MWVIILSPKDNFGDRHLLISILSSRMFAGGKCTRCPVSRDNDNVKGMLMMLAPCKSERDGCEDNVMALS